MKKKITIFEIICYVVAAILAIVSFYMLYANIAYMNEYLEAYGMTMSDLGSQAAQSIIGAFVPYFAYAFLVLAVGMVYRVAAAQRCVCEEAPLEAVVEDVQESETPVAEEAAAEAQEAVEEAEVEEPMPAEESAAADVVEEPEASVVADEAPVAVEAAEETAEEEK